VIATRQKGDDFMVLGFFNLGIAEIIILGICALMPIVIAGGVLFVLLDNRQKEQPRDRDDEPPP
jgi:hypothetical protein